MVRWIPERKLQQGVGFKEDEGFALSPCVGVRAPCGDAGRIASVREWMDGLGLVIEKEPFFQFGERAPRHAKTESWLAERGRDWGQPHATRKRDGWIPPDGAGKRRWETQRTRTRTLTRRRRRAALRGGALLEERLQLRQQRREHRMQPRHLRRRQQALHHSLQQRQ